MRDGAEIAHLARRLPGRRAFVTGAASGLGRALALALARDGWRLGLADLNADRLERVRAEVQSAGGRATAYTGDVAAAEFVAGAIATFVGVVHGCRAAVPVLRRQGAGVILNIASSAGRACRRGFFRTGLLETMRAPPAESATAHRLMEGSGYEAADAARAILAATARRRLYIVWPREYLWLWRIKRLAPVLFLRLVQRMRSAPSVRAEHPRPG
jgi:NAD(P)-dependent dehydrogenase (short-subunit alcohol dehydrogenase family)